MLPPRKNREIRRPLWLDAKWLRGDVYADDSDEVGNDDGDEDVVLSWLQPMLAQMMMAMAITTAITMTMTIATTTTTAMRTDDSDRLVQPSSQAGSSIPRFMSIPDDYDDVDGV